MWQKIAVYIAVVRKGAEWALTPPEFGVSEKRTEREKVNQKPETRDIMQLFSANATVFNKENFFLPMKT